MKSHWQDWGNLVLGLWIIASPWVLPLGTATGAEAAAPTSVALWSLSIVGIVITGLAIAALVTFYAWEEWTNVVLGAWLVISPWALGFSSSALFTWNMVIVGALVVILAGWTLAPAQGSPQGPAKHA